MRKLKDWSLTPGQWEPFWRQLSDDPELAGLRYIRLHAKLEKYFLNNTSSDPNDLADRTIDRLARILEEDPIESSQIEFLAIGIARNIVREEWRRITVRERLAAQFRGWWRSRSRPDHECVEWAFEQLPQREKELIEDFYAVQKTEGGLAQHRRHLAQQLGISYDALRSRACEIRRKLRRLYQARCNKTIY